MAVLHLGAAWSSASLRGTIGANHYGPDPVAPKLRQRGIDRVRHRNARAATMSALPAADPIAIARDLLRCPR